MLDFTTLGGLVSLHKQGRLNPEGYVQMTKLLLLENSNLYTKLGRLTVWANKARKDHQETVGSKAAAANEMIRIMEG